MMSQEPHKRKVNQMGEPMRKGRSLIVGVVCGAVCVAGMMLYAHEIELNVEQERAEVLARYGSTQVEAYVATCDIAEGSKVDSANVERRLMPGELLPEGAVTDLAQIKAQPAQARIYSGEVLLTQRFEQVDGSVLQVPDGLCAVSVPAKAVSAVGGSVRAGDKVNVYSTSAKSTDLLVANVEVLATSASTGSKKDEANDVSWITLAAKPSEVNELIAAAGVSDLYFTLPSEKFVASDMRSNVKAQSGEMAADSENAVEGDEGKNETSASKTAGALSDSSLSVESSTGEANSEEASGAEGSSKTQLNGKKEA